MYGVINETAMHKFASKVYVERHDLCFCFIWRMFENAVSQRYVDVKGIDIAKAAKTFENK